MHKLRGRLLRNVVGLGILHAMRSWRLLELDRGDDIKLVCALPRGHRIVIPAVIFMHDLRDRPLLCGRIIYLWGVPLGVLLGIFGGGELHELRGGVLRARHCADSVLRRR